MRLVSVLGLLWLAALALAALDVLLIPYISLRVTALLWGVIMFAQLRRTLSRREQANLDSQLSNLQKWHVMALLVGGILGLLVLVFAPELGQAMR